MIFINEANDIQLVAIYEANQLWRDVSHIFHIKMSLQFMTGKQISFNIIIN